MALAQSVTFKVADVKPNEARNQQKTTVSEYVTQTTVAKLGGTLLKSTQEASNAISPALSNGFVGAAFTAYNNHHNLIIKPDDVWIAITTSLANYIDKNSEKMRHLFVTHEGQKELEVLGSGSITTANYPALISAMSDLIDKNTKAEIRTWLECDFSTTTPVSRTVSKVVLMGAMKNYFSYKMGLLCGLPSVTLEGNIKDWEEIRKRVDLLATWGFEELSTWSRVLAYVLDKFIEPFNGTIDKDFWNRIAHQTGGGSGPRYLEGWIIAFVPWTDAGKFVLPTVEEIKQTNSFGKMNTNDVPISAVEVPVAIDDNGTKYKTIFYAGALVSDYDEKTNSIRASLEWALIDVTNPTPQKKSVFC